MVQKKVDELIAAIKTTSEFKNLQKTQNAIMKNKSLKKQVDDYQTKRMDLFSESNSGKDIQNEMKSLEQEFKNLTKIPEVSAFLKAGKAFNEMMARTNQYINEQLDKSL